VRVTTFSCCDVLLLRGRSRRLTRICLRGSRGTAGRQIPGITMSRAAQSWKRRRNLSASPLCENARMAGQQCIDAGLLLVVLCDEFTSCLVSAGC
jgi:hypothetical protein